MLLATYMDIVMAMIFRLVICSFAPVSGYWAKVPIFGAMGPYTVTADKISDPDQLDFPLYDVRAWRCYFYRYP